MTRASFEQRVIDHGALKLTTWRPPCWPPKRTCWPLVLPAGALEEAVVDEPARAPAPGDQASLDVVGVFPNDAAIERWVTAVVVEQHEWRSATAVTCPGHRWPGSARHPLSWPPDPNTPASCRLALRSSQRRPLLLHDAGRHHQGDHGRSGTAVCPTSPPLLLARSRCVSAPRPPRPFAVSGPRIA